MTQRLKKVTGVWRGTFRYDPMEGVSSPGPVSFTLKLQQGWFGRFTGSVTEEGQGAMPGTGKIEGYFSFPHIEFRKWMPISYIMTPEGHGITFREWAISNGYKCERDVSHGPIRYSGEFTDVSKAQGIWIIQARRLEADEAAFELPEATGTWSAEKVS